MIPANWVLTGLGKQRQHQNIGRYKHGIQFWMNCKKISARKFIALILQSFLIWGQSWTRRSAGTHANTTHIQWQSTCTNPIKLGQEFQKHLMFPSTSLHWHQDAEYWPVTSKAKGVGRWSTAEACLLPSLGWKFSTTLQASAPLSETIFNNRTMQQLHKNPLSHKQLAYN